MLGYDPLQVANEGKMVCIVAADQAQAALEAMKSNRYGADAAIIGTVANAHPDRGPSVFVRNAFGGRRILSMLVGEAAHASARAMASKGVLKCRAVRHVLSLSS